MSSDASFCGLPGELQDHIILFLHPTAMIALSKTSRHFHATAFLARLETHTIDEFLEERKHAILSLDDDFKYLCCSCFKLKFHDKFTRSHLKDYYRRNVKKVNGRSCVDCMLAQGKISPGDVLNMGFWEKVVCLVCLSLEDHFCTRCKWCYGCAQKTHNGVRTYRKIFGKETPSHDADGMIQIWNTCVGHSWSEPSEL